MTIYFSPPRGQIWSPPPALLSGLDFHTQPPKEVRSVFMIHQKSYFLSNLFTLKIKQCSGN